MLNVEYYLKELVKEESILGNTNIEFAKCEKCGIPFVTECGDRECVICSGKVMPLFVKKEVKCPVCGLIYIMERGNKSSCSSSCTKKANKLGIYKKDRLEMIKDGKVLKIKKKKGYGINKMSWSGKNHPWKGKCHAKRKV
jgi:rubredoxin